jgi:hypothetical protein
MVRIGGAQGFWGDRNDALAEMLKNDEVSYVASDYLAELTLSIMQRQKQRNPNGGYARDFLTALDMALPYLVSGKTRIITNAGGINVKKAVDDLQTILRQKEKKCKIGYVLGDDFTDRLDNLRKAGIDLENSETGEPYEAIKDNIIAANVYHGHEPMLQCLAEGADIVVTGRATDSSLFLAPLAYEQGWSTTDWDDLATGILAGHLLECGAQVTGGNYDYDWLSVPSLENVGFPIAEVENSGEIVLTKCKNTGGSVTEQSCKEQLLYEIHDPANYITPDVIADFSQLTVTQIGENRVRIAGVKGKQRPDKLKLCIGYLEGYRIEAYLPYSWPNAMEKARKASEIIMYRLEKQKAKIDRVRVDLVGIDSLHMQIAPVPAVEPNEVVLRVALFGKDRKEVEKMSGEIAPLILDGPPGVCFFGGRPRATEVYGLWTTYIPRDAVELQVCVEEVK